MRRRKIIIIIILLAIITLIGVYLLFFRGNGGLSEFTMIKMDGLERSVKLPSGSKHTTKDELKLTGGVLETAETFAVNLPAADVTAFYEENYKDLRKVQVSIGLNSLSDRSEPYYCDGAWAFRVEILSERDGRTRFLIRYNLESWGWHYID